MNFQPVGLIKLAQTEAVLVSSWDPTCWFIHAFFSFLVLNHIGKTIRRAPQKLKVRVHHGKTRITTEKQKVYQEANEIITNHKATPN